MRKFLLVALLLSATHVHAEDIQFIVRIDGVTCPFCVATSERTLAKIHGVHSVRSNLRTGTIYVCADKTVNLTGEQLGKLFRERGFTFRSVRRTQGCEDAATGRPGPRAGKPEAEHRHDDGDH